MAAQIRISNVSVRTQTYCKQNHKVVNSNQMPFGFIFTATARFPHCCRSSSPPLFENRMCLSFEGVPSRRRQLCYFPGTAVASISHPRLSLSGTNNTGGTGYSIPPLCIFRLSEPIFPLALILLCFFSLR